MILNLAVPRWAVFFFIGGENMKDKITKLIDVKSIVTLVLTGVFSYMAVIGTIGKDDFMMIFAMIIAYFFSKVKKEDK